MPPPLALSFFIFFLSFSENMPQDQNYRSVGEESKPLRKINRYLKIPNRYLKIQYIKNSECTLMNLDMSPVETNFFGKISQLGIEFLATLPSWCQRGNCECPLLDMSGKCINLVREKSC